MINTIPTCVHSLTVIFQIQLRVLLCPVLPAELVNFHHTCLPCADRGSLRPSFQKVDFEDKTEQ